MPAISQICCQRLGLPTQAANSKLAFLRQAQYDIKIQHGLSTNYISNDTPREIYGVLQGSGAAPAIWLSLSIVIINAYNALLFPTISFHNPLSTVILHKLLDAFVDNTDLWDILFNLRLHHDYDAIKRMELCAQTWERLLHFSGGKSNLDKCFWYYISWTWDHGIPTLATIQDTPGDISLLFGHSSVPKLIKRVKTTDALKTLGLPTSPSGTTSAQYKYLSVKLHDIVTKLKNVVLTRSKVDIVIPVYVHPKLTYCFSGTTFSKQ